MNVPEITSQVDGVITVTDVIVCLTGIILFSGWLIKTSFGRNALADSIPRRNNMLLYFPFIPLFICFGSVPLAISIARKLLPGLPDWQNIFLDNLILCIGAIAAIGVIIFLAEISFARRLKGFGLDIKTIPRDFFAGLVNLISVLPLVLSAIIFTTLLGRFIFGKEFVIRQHQELELIADHPQLPVRIVIIITAVAVVPLFEEMLFRGLFQTMIRSYLLRPWLSIAASSALFAVVHANAGHWLALFVLAVCLGYSYEKSGSLFRPVFIHAIFNAISITAALT